MKQVLFVSNGAGEDAIASLIIRHLPEFEIHALPLVGEGAGYPASARRLGKSRRLPSEGLLRESLGGVVRDLAAGLPLYHLGQLRLLRRIRRDYALTVAVGDLFPVAMAGLAGHRPLLFVGTAKSIWHHRYSRGERAALRTFADFVLARDDPTAQVLRQAGIPAAWVGNAMMDELESTGLFRLEPGEQGIAVFPGSREAAYRELPRQLEVYRRLLARGNPIRAMVAVARSVDVERLARSCTGWRYRARSESLGVVGELERTEAPAVPLVRGALGDVLQHATVALGQAGTANEQAAGLGVPVVACAPGGESHLGWYRGRQKGLLGEAVVVVEEDLEALVEAVERLVRDPEERRRRGAVGRRRMGPAGGGKRMAAVIAQMAEELPIRPETPA
ncbi:MAG: hypothetical protein HY319_31660 [Armatimonadetes bacterium]|nr:hypothetical protein [Armatimonadota bacterium]